MRHRGPALITRVPPILLTPTSQPVIRQRDFASDRELLKEAERRTGVSNSPGSLWKRKMVGPNETTMTVAQEEKGGGMLRRMILVLAAAALMAAMMALMAAPAFA